MALTLVATSGVKTSAPAAGSEIHVLTVADGDVVTLTATSDGATALGDVTWTLDGTAVAGATQSDTNDPTSKAIKVTVSGADQRGLYIAATKSNGGPEVKSNRVSLEAAAAAEASEEEDDGSVSEVEVGEMDKPFAYVSLLVVAAFSAAIIWVSWRIVSRIALPASAVIEKNAETFGTWDERSASIVHILALAGGLVTLLVGAWLAAIETRGRLRIPTVAVNSQTGERGQIDAKTAEAVGAILGKARRLRGAIAVVVAGVFVVGFAVWGASGM